ncbi:MAG: hypothetical protein ACFFBP_12750 [Promethearchaeota archaeon]
MRINDLEKKVSGLIFSKEMTVEDDGEGITYVFPDTKEFLSMAKRKFVNRGLLSEEQL